MNIEKKVFIVTGGASGLGRATSEMLLKEGASVAVFDINESSGIELQDQLGAKCLFLKVDITSEIDVADAIEKTLQRFQIIHGLINCAGIGPASRVVGKEGPHSLDFFKKVLDVNLNGPFNTIRLTVNEIQKNKPSTSGERGVVINTASVAAYDGQIGQAAYSASKGGLVAMTLPMAREFARMGVRVMCIAPGIFETPLLKGLSEDVQSSLAKQIPFPSRLGRAEEFAFLVKQIIENPMLNGEVIRLDGAIRMGAK
ncbi:3-hydroxyacyl-CoA dehydrogenase [Jiulongibacter sp. NS-SX5]|uniref:3-hydroxyacyl-CoA dehydrogenase n=1 Tax=Jiulongibacter sp. NS-SX5 TaxID=3463854 RepID=UPI004059009F